MCCCFFNCLVLEPAKHRLQRRPRNGKRPSAMKRAKTHQPQHLRTNNNQSDLFVVISLSPWFYFGFQWFFLWSKKLKLCFFLEGKYILRPKTAKLAFFFFAGNHVFCSKNSRLNLPFFFPETNIYRTSQVFLFTSQNKRTIVFCFCVKLREKKAHSNNPFFCLVFDSLMFTFFCSSSST